MASTALAYRQPLGNPRYDDYYDRSAYGRAAARQRMQAEPLRRERREQPRPQVQPQRELRVLEGKARAAAPVQALAPMWKRLFAVGLVVVFMLGVTLLARVSLTDATMAMTSSSEQLSQSIANARLAGAQLEFEYAKATNTVTIQDLAANQLGMTTDPQVEYLPVAEG